jgi:hypothetical protein
MLSHTPKSAILFHQLMFPSVYHLIQVKAHGRFQINIKHCKHCRHCIHGLQKQNRILLITEYKIAWSKKWKRMKKNSMAFSPQVNYFHWAATTGWWILVPTFTDRGVSCGQCSRNPTAINLSFIDHSPLLFLSSSSSFILTRLSGPCSRHNATQKIW